MSESSNAQPGVDPATILFPNDQPAAQAPRAVGASDWHKENYAYPLSQPNSGHAKNAKAEQAADKADDDAASKIFKNDVATFDEGAVSGLLEPFRLGAISDGDGERAEALQAATTGLASNLKSAGTDTAAAKDAFAIMRERSDFLQPPTPETMEAEHNESMATLQAELGESLDSDLDAARRFIGDLEKVSPGLIQTLEVSGAGNDIRLIRSVIAEAKRRKY